MTLKTDYKDYQFQEGETLRKYQEISNNDGTISLRDVTSYQQEGDRFSASDINSTNAKVNDLNQTVGDIQTDVSGLQTDVSKLQAKSFEGTNGTIETQDGYLHDMMIFGKSVQDGTPTPDNPIEIQSVVNPKVTVCGKNLLKPTLETTTTNGVTCTNNGDGTYTVNGTASKNTVFYLVNSDGINLNIGDNTKLIGCPSGGSSSKYSLTIYDAINSEWFDEYGNGNIVLKTNKISCYIQIKNGVTVNNLVFKPMLTYDLNATYDDFEPYKGQSATLPYTLNAIPVSEGGNVTIDGQQYISDYVDIENKKLVRNVGEVDLGSLDYSKYGSTNSVYKCSFSGYKPPLTSAYVANALCKSYVLSSVNRTSSALDDKSVGLSGGGDAIYICDTTYTNVSDLKNSLNGVTLLYELATPTETTLTDEEVSQFKALKTYEPTTNIIASSDVLNPLVKCDYSLNKETNNIYDRLQENASDVSNITTRLNGLSFVTLTQTEYDALEVKDDNTIYFITEG